MGKSSSILVMLALIVSFGSCAQKRPITHDPVVAKQGDTYYLFCTGPGITSFTSKDLKNWTQEDPVFAESPEWALDVAPGFNGHIWAPDISFHNGTYYLYYSISAFGKNTSAIGLVTNATLNPDDANYKWEDQGIVIQSVPNRDLWNAIDPNLIFDESGIPWLAFGSFWNGLKMVKMNANLKEVAQPEEWHTIARRDRDAGLADDDPGNAALEGPFIFKKDDYYYQFLSWDFCCRGEDSTYKLMVGRSKSVMGPYLDKDGKRLDEGGGSMVIEGNKNWYGVGHNSVFTFDGKDYNFMHGYDASDNGLPKLIVKEVNWEGGWPVVAPME
ncbi:arabinan endo-1,5-alpha-L-arabinosidase [Allomuricauda sp. NBRC 101325]|uniref:arabinan endo-1,5-alpha-L-arabinosidase n=1 Tax=Allomuricauda sp. NBRC 101325 TaxID=1113758 RepID=UPI0024A2C603|nr:arabinan endo-1,5-alpha-L-arabinosidase [Muricauda sp. NBRC 101325]GLU43918.1 extracellular endo-alpha-(1->5)-L-arabinanase 1 [Muricauda sp. NBRC 101325]